jgi:hypothetical protein
MNTMGRHFEPLAQAIAAGSTVSAAIESIGVSRSHGYRLSRLPELRTRVAEIRSASTSATVGLLTEAARKAVGVLTEIMDDREAKDGDRITAARAVLQTLGPLSELAELRSRLDALEASQWRVTA